MTSNRKDIDKVWHKGYNKALADIKKIVSEWKDVGIKGQGNISLMITNGGYIKKWDLLAEIKELEK